MKSAPGNVRAAAEALKSMQRQSWEQGVAMQAFCEMGETETVVRMAFEAVNRGLPDGRCAMAGAMDGATDPCACGEALGFAARVTGHPALRAGYEALLDWALRGAPRSPGGVVYHLTGSRQFWVDSMYMLPPFLAGAGRFDEALVNLDGYWDRLYDREARLMRHQWDEGAGAFRRAAHWGVGNGWAVAALARMYDLLPEERAEDRARVAEMARSLIGGLTDRMRPDGLFHDVVDDPASFVEVNLSQQLAYALYRGMASGWLPGSFAATAKALRQAASARQDGFGFIRGVCGAPAFDRPGIAPGGQAFFLLMECAARRHRGAAKRR